MIIPNDPSRWPDFPHRLIVKRAKTDVEKLRAGLRAIQEIEFMELNLFEEEYHLRCKTEEDLRRAEQAVFLMS